MNTLTIVACLSLALVGQSWATTLGEHTGSAFCYRDADGCGPKTAAWDHLCHEGKRQSPIDIPALTKSTGSTPLKLNVYRSDAFRCQNNGHSVSFDFNGVFPEVSFPDSVLINGANSSQHGHRLYRFAAGHFHWGVKDNAVGSEHCIGGVCRGMELHLVHYLAEYKTMAAAVASNDERALTVLGVLIDVSKMEGFTGMVKNFFSGNNITSGTGALKPIVDNLGKIEHADHDSTKWTTVNQKLDLTPLLVKAAAEGVLSYKGSLTTPGCNEQVNWFVLKKPATSSHQDLEAFRTIIKDGENKTLTENHRPLMPLNNRTVLLSTVISA